MSDLLMPKSYTLPFLKMHGLGNDFIFIDGENLLQSETRPLLSQWFNVVPDLTRQLCHRRLSIGADGLILAMPLHNHDLKKMAINLYGDFAADCDLSWTYHNNDGSQSHMCGNGLRCLALWAKLEKNMIGQLKVATKNGPVIIDLVDEDNISVTMGAPKLKASQIPFRTSNGQENEIVRYPFVINGLKFPITCVNMGNPHCLIFESDFLKPDLFAKFDKGLSDNEENVDVGQDFYPKELASIARSIEIDERFPERTNVHFARVVDRSKIQVFVWERGCGPTLASGSAAMASLVAGVLEGRLDRKAAVTLPGGTLYIEWLADDNIKMTGAADLSFRGQVKLKGTRLNQRDNKRTKA